MRPVWFQAHFERITMLKAYKALRDVNFMDGSLHVMGRTYFPKKDEQAYYDVCAASYEIVEVETKDLGRRTIVLPDHEHGYTRNFLVSWMLSTGVYDPANFFKWMSGQTIGRADDGQSVYYVCDVERYFKMGGPNAPIID